MGSLLPDHKWLLICVRYKVYSLYLDVFAKIHQMETITDDSEGFKGIYLEQSCNRTYKTQAA